MADRGNGPISGRVLSSCSSYLDGLRLALVLRHAHSQRDAGGASRRPGAGGGGGGREVVDARRPGQRVTDRPLRASRSRPGATSCWRRSSYRDRSADRLLPASDSCSSAPGWWRPRRAEHLVVEPVLCIAAITGDSVGYAIGCGPRLFTRPQSPSSTQAHRADAPVLRSPAQTVVIAHFVPIPYLCPGGGVGQSTGASFSTISPGSMVDQHDGAGYSDPRSRTSATTSTSWWGS